jgi:hypothetical protein
MLKMEYKSCIYCGKNTTGRMCSECSRKLPLVRQIKAILKKAYGGETNG